MEKGEGEEEGEEEEEEENIPTPLNFVEKMGEMMMRKKENDALDKQALVS